MSGFIDQTDVDFIVNGQGQGSLAQDVTSGRFTLENSVGFDPGILRPVIQTDGQKYCRIKTGRIIANKKGDESYVENQAEGARVPESKYVPLQTLINRGTVPHTYNSSALPYDTWRRIDKGVLKASRDRLQAWSDMEAANSYGGFNGMAVTALVKDTMTDPGSAKIDMDTLSDDFGDQPLFYPDILPLPIIHAGAAISQRRLAQSRNGGMPLDTTLIEAAGRRCGETLENITIGMTDVSDLVAGGTTTDFTKQGIYGYRTSDYRITKIDLTASASFVAETFVQEVIAMIELARAQKFYGPFVLYYSTAWDQYLARDYYVITTQGAAAPTRTVLQRVEAIKKIQAVKALDMFTSTDELLLVQMTSDTVRAVNGMDFTTVQWSGDGGAKTMLRVMGIKVPDIRSQFIGTSTTVANRKCGVVHGTTS